MCIFLKDGSFISADDLGIRRISTDSTKMWEIRGHYHHQLNLSFDRKKILALSSSLFQDTKRQDKLQVLSVDGKILSEQNVSQYFIRPIEKDLSIQIPNIRIENKEVSQEYSHFNSFYEIPPFSPNASGPSWLKSGNYIVNGIEHGYLVISSNLEKVLHHGTFLNSHQHHVHDVQVTKRGTILFYNNLVKSTKKMLKDYLGGPSIELRYSGIYEVEPVSHKILRKFEATPKQIFFGWVSGGVQEIDDSTWIFNHFLNGTFIYDHKRKKMVNSFVTTNAGTNHHSPLQDVKVAELSDFLKYWR
jgi:hypothetical protein